MAVQQPKTQRIQITNDETHTALLFTGGAPRDGRLHRVQGHRRRLGTDGRGVVGTRRAARTGARKRRADGRCAGPLDRRGDRRVGIHPDALGGRRRRDESDGDRRREQRAPRPNHARQGELPPHGGQRPRHGGAHSPVVGYGGADAPRLPGWPRKPRVGVRTQHRQYAAGHRRGYARRGPHPRVPSDRHGERRDHRALLRPSYRHDGTTRR